MGVEGSIDCVFTHPISMQSVWQASVGITTPLQVAFFSHRPVSSPLSVGAVHTRSTEGQQMSTMCSVVKDVHWETANTQLFH